MKLSTKNLEKLLSLATGKEIDLAIYLAQHQDDDGVVRGIHYGIASKHLGISTSTFYKSLNRLESYGIIDIDWRHFAHEDAGAGWGFWSMKFLDNNYTLKNYSKQPYLNMNYEVLHTQRFYKLPLNAKKIILNIMRIMYLHFKTNKEGINLNIKTIMRWTGTSRRSVMDMLANIAGLKGSEKILEISMCGNTVIIPLNHGLDFKLHERRPRTEADTKAIHAVHYAINKMKQAVTSYQGILDVCTVLRQYKLKGFILISGIVMRSIKECGYFSAKHIHHLIREMLGQERAADKEKRSILEREEKLKQERMEVQRQLYIKIRELRESREKSREKGFCERGLVRQV